MKKALSRLLDWMYPKRAVCMGCDSAAGFERDWLCEDCRKALAKNWIGAFSDSALEGAAAAYHYYGPAGSVVRKMKFDGIRALAEPMARDMLRAYAQIQPTGAEIVIPVPMHPKRLKKRPYNQSDVLAVCAAEMLELPVSGVLVRLRNTEQQSKLEEEARRQSLEGAFRADHSVAGRRVLLVDDVYTTGGTARECAKALKNAGAVSVSLLVYAKGGK